MNKIIERLQDIITDGDNLFVLYRGKSYAITCEDIPAGALKQVKQYVVARVRAVETGK